MIARRNHVAGALEKIRVVSMAQAIGMMLVATLATPLVALGRVRVGTRFLGAGGAFVAFVMLILMQLIYIVMFTLIGLVMNPASILRGGPTLQHYSPLAFDYFSKGVFLLLVCRLWAAHRREARGEEVHSRSSGYPYLGYWCSLYAFGEAATRVVVEPLAWLLVAWFVKRADVIIGSYLQLSAVSLFVLNMTEINEMRNLERDERDARIEGRHLEEFAAGRAAPGYRDGLAYPALGRAAYAEELRRRKGERPAYAPGEAPEVGPLMAHLAAEETTAENRARFIRRLEEAAAAEADA